MKGSLIIIAFFVLGIVMGHAHLMPAIDGDLTFYALCALMFGVGMGVGSDPTTLRKMRTQHPALLLLPVATMLGTFAGVLVVACLSPSRSATDCLALGSGFGYYSLSSIFITEYKGVELGTLALLSNISRELITLVGAPLMARCFGPLAPISAGGATTMDTTLPIITRTSGQEYVIVSIFHGFVMDFSVPFWVVLFASL